MRCLICQSQLPAEGWQCPKCGDHVGQWMEMNALASQFHTEGMSYAAGGQTLRAALCLTKAAVLNPGDPAILASLGKFVAQCGDYEYASYYLNKALSVAETQALPCPEDAVCALKKLEQLRESPGEPASPLLNLIAFSREDGQRLVPAKSVDGSESPCELAEGPQIESTDVSTNGGAEAWLLATDLESSCHPGITVIAPVLAWPQPPIDHLRGPWLYLRGVMSLAAGDNAAAERLFRESAAADGTHRNPDIYLLYLSQLQGDVRPAIAFLQEQKRSDDDIAETLSIAAKIQESRRDIEGAGQFLRIAAEMVTCEDRRTALNEHYARLEEMVDRQESVEPSDEPSESESLEADAPEDNATNQNSGDAASEPLAS